MELMFLLVQIVFLGFKLWVFRFMSNLYGRHYPNIRNDERPKVTFPKPTAKICTSLN